jgi:phytoene desaturase
MKEHYKCIVVGAGIAGIAAAIRMRMKGYEVHVVEANLYPGGKLTAFSLGGFRFDAGPSLFTLPELVDELILLCGKKPENYLTYKRCEIVCNYFYEDGTRFSFFSDPTKRSEELITKLKLDPALVEAHLKRSRFSYEATKNTFLEKSLHRWKTYFSPGILKTIAAIPRLNLNKTMHEVNEKHLKHPKLIQLFDRYATYNGSNPYVAPGILTLIPHLEANLGAYYPTNGMHQITTGLVDLANDIGVQFSFGRRVDEICVDKNGVNGVRIGSEVFSADVVFCNSDVKPAYKYLLPNLKKPSKILAQEPSSSALIFYWGISQQFPELDLHSIFFSADYKKEFSEIFEKNTLPEDPTVYINVSSKKSISDAPNGSENWFVMINVPANNGQDWNFLRQKARRIIIDKISRLLGVQIEPLIVVEDYLDPIRIETRTSSAGGALYGTSSNDRMAAFFRHPNFSTVKGLFFIGGSVHPGGGIPLCLYSAKIATDLVPQVKKEGH